MVYWTIEMHHPLTHFMQSATKLMDGLNNKKSNNKENETEHAPAETANTDAPAKEQKKEASLPLVTSLLLPRSFPLVPSLLLLLPTPTTLRLSPTHWARFPSSVVSLVVLEEVFK